MYECCNDEDAERGLGAFLEGWGDRTTKPFGLRAGRLPIFNHPPDSPGRRPFFLVFMRVFGESYLPLLGAIRGLLTVRQYGIIGVPATTFSFASLRWQRFIFTMEY